MFDRIAWKRNWRKERRGAGLCPDCSNLSAPGNSHCQEHLDKMTARHLRLKIEAFEAYGGCKCDCPGCNVTNPKFLTIDHKNNDGAEHRKTIGRGAAALYGWLKKNGYPPGYRVQCFNCNLGRSANQGVCPHEEEAPLPSLV